MGTKEMEAEITALKAQLAAKSQLSIKVSEKGAVSVYGLQRFPVTLYGEQWKRVIEYAPTISQFLTDNAHRLAHKA